MVKLTKIKGFGRQKIPDGLDYCLDLKFSLIKVPLATVYFMALCPHYKKIYDYILESSNYKRKSDDVHKNSKNLAGKIWIVSGGCTTPIVTSIRDIAVTHADLAQRFGLDSRMFVLSEVPEAYMLEFTKQGIRPYEKKPENERILESAFVLSALAKVSRSYSIFLENIV